MAKTQKGQAGYPGASAPPTAELLENHDAVHDRKASLDSNKVTDPTKDAWRKLIAESWKELKEVEKNGLKKGGQKNAGDSSGDVVTGGPQKDTKSKGMFGFFKKSSDGGKNNAQEGVASNASSSTNNNSNGKTFDVPQTFDEMCTLNCNMIGANMTYIKAVASCWETMIAATVSGDDGRLELETNMACMRINKEVEGTFRVPDFKLCMLASLRSLMPKSWSVAHDQAWNQMWDKVEGLLTQNMELPKKYEKPVRNLVEGMSDADKSRFGLNAFNRLFDASPKAENHFITSNQRLSYLATQSLEMSMLMYKEPTRMIQQAQSLGLRHIMYNIDTAFFEGLVKGICDEIATFTTDQTAIAGVEWSLTQIACTMVYTIKTGSTPILQAVSTNNIKELKVALQGESRKNRALACLSNETSSSRQASAIGANDDSASQAGSQKSSKSKGSQGSKGRVSM